MRAMRTVSAWMSLRRPARLPRTWAESARMSVRRFWKSAWISCRRSRKPAWRSSRSPWIPMRISARRARKSRRVSYRCATRSGTQIAPMARVAISSTDRVGSRVVVYVLTADLAPDQAGEGARTNRPGDGSWLDFRWRSQLAPERSSRVIAAIATGEDTFDDAFKAGRALGQGLYVLTEVAKISSDFCSEVLDVRPRVAPEGQH